MSLEAHHLSLYRSARALVDGISLSLHPGEVLVILGSNGAGKSTLLRCLSGELKPDAGEIRLNGVALDRWSAADCAKRRAILPQHSPLSFPFTALEVAAMGRIPYGGPGPGDIQIALEALAAAQVVHLAERRYTTLSGGERQRVHMARILAQLWTPLPDDEPRYLLLDEPTASLDLAHQHSTLALARRWSERNIGVLAVLHDLNLAAQYGDRIALMKDGRLLVVDRPETVLEPTGIEHAFGLPVRVIAHPELDCPLVVPRRAASRIPEHAG